MYLTRGHRWVAQHPTPAPQAYPTAPSAPSTIGQPSTQTGQPMTKGARHPASVSCGLLHVRLASLTHREHPPPRTYRPLPCLTPQLRRQPNRRRQRLANPWRKARANPQACPVACYTFGLHPSLTASTLCLAHTSHCLALAHYSFVDECNRSASVCGPSVLWGCPVRCRLRAVQKAAVESAAGDRSVKLYP